MATPLNQKIYYRGYSSYEYQNSKNFQLTNAELVKLDILNHIFTRKGERVMMPSFGTRIPDLAFEPMDRVTLDVLESDLSYVFNYDPRVVLLDLNIIPNYDTNSVVASARVRYVELDLIGDINLNIEFEGSQQ